MNSFTVVDQLQPREFTDATAITSGGGVSSHAEIRSAFANKNRKRAARGTAQNMVARHGPPMRAGVCFKPRGLLCRDVSF
jgi:hypothetical protein